MEGVAEVRVAESGQSKSNLRQEQRCPWSSVENVVTVSNQLIIKSLTENGRSGVVILKAKIFLIEGSQVRLDSDQRRSWFVLGQPICRGSSRVGMGDMGA